MNDSAIDDSSSTTTEELPVFEKSGILDLSAPAGASTRVVEASFILSEPQSHLRVKLPAGSPGRAEARLPGGTWAAKHYWQESPAVVVYEFDGPLPAGRVNLRVPLEPS